MDFDTKTVIQSGQFSQARSLALMMFSTFFSAYIVPGEPSVFDYGQLAWQLYLIGIGLLIVAWYLQVMSIFFSNLFIGKGSDFEEIEYSSVALAKLSQRSSRYARFTDLLSVSSIVCNLGFLGAITYPSLRFGFSG